MRRHLQNRLARLELEPPFFTPSVPDPDARMPRQFCQGLARVYGEPGKPDFTLTRAEVTTALDRVYHPDRPA